MQARALPSAGMGAREQMIDAGERLAAERGLAAMSLREVQAAAGQRNKSAAHYHFGDRRGLIEAIAAARMGPINQVRQDLVDDLAPDAGVRDLVEAIVVPIAEATSVDGSCWARFLAQGLADPELSDVVRRTFEAGPFRDVRRRLVEAIATTVPEELRERRVDHAVGVLVMSLAASEASHAAGLAPRLPVAAQVADLVDICTAVVAAPVSTVTANALSDGSRQSA
jgi:AcrR family transcriptional regulator